MVDMISNYILNKFFCDSKSTDDDKEILLFGIKRIVEDVPKTILMVLIFYFTGNIIQLGIVFLVTLMYKSFIGGAHARTNIGCFIGTMVIFGTPVIISKLNINMMFLMSVMIINFIYSVYVIYKIAPSDTEEVPLINKNIRRNMKIFASISIILIYIFCLTRLNDPKLVTIIIFEVLLINIYTSNMMYKLFRCTRGKDSLEYKDLYSK